MATAYILGSGLATYVSAMKADFGSPSDIADTDYRDLLIKAIRRVNLRARTTFSYYSSTSGISPTPNEKQADLILAQAECLLAKRRYAVAVSKGISVKDGDTAIDSTAAFGGHRELVTDFCGDFNDLLKEYLLENSGSETYGELIWQGNTRIKERNDHDGDASFWRYYESPYDDSIN